MEAPTLKSPAQLDWFLRWMKKAGYTATIGFGDEGYSCSFYDDAHQGLQVSGHAKGKSMLPVVRNAAEAALQ